MPSETQKEERLFPEQLLSSSISERVEFFENYHIAHPHLSKAIREVLDVINNPGKRSLVMVIGPSGVGKSTLFKSVVSNVIRNYVAQNRGQIPIVGVEALAPDSSNFDIKDFYIRSLQSLREPLIEYKISCDDDVEIQIGKKDANRQLRRSLENALKYRSPKAFLDEYEKYVDCWKWVLLSQITGILVKDSGLGDSEIVGDLRHFHAHVFKDNPYILQKLVNKRIKRGVRTPEGLLEKYDFETKLTYSIQEINEFYEMILSDIKYDDNKFMLLIDGLDEKVKKDKIYNEAIIGLLWTIKRLNTKFYNEGVPMKFVIMLRSDVYNHILDQGSNLNKLGEDNEVELDWISASSNKLEYPLAELISLRINNSITKNGLKPVIDPIYDLLPERVHGKDWSRPTWDWMLDMTTYKPRDIINFLNCCKDLSKSGEKSITESVIWSALKDYSEYLVKEFKAELYGHFTSNQINELFESVFPKVGKSFSYKNFEKVFEVSEYFNQLDPVDILNLLTKLGILGTIDKFGHAQWEYRRKTIVKQDIRTSKFQIHLGLWKVLSFW